MATRRGTKSRTENLRGPAWAAIVQAVHAGHPLMYTELARAVASHQQSRALHGALGLIQQECQTRGWPDLSAAVVRKASGVPEVRRLGRRERRTDWVDEWGAVQAFSWPSTPPGVSGLDTQ
jgi:hypothetical protein